MRRPTAGQAAIGAVIAAVLAVMIAALYVIGSPAAERRRRLDDRRIDDLERIAAAVDERWRQTGQLPASVDELSRERTFTLPSDPVTGGRYDYRVLGGSSYELCAGFQENSRDDRDRSRGHTPFWNHGAGRHCYQLEARQNRLPR
jgi:hypothetical protein